MRPPERDVFGVQCGAAQGHGHQLASFERRPRRRRVEEAQGRVRDQFLAAIDVDLAVDDAPAGLEHRRVGDQIVRRQRGAQKAAVDRSGRGLLHHAVERGQRDPEHRIAEAHDRAAVDRARAVHDLAAKGHAHARLALAHVFEVEVEGLDEVGLLFVPGADGVLHIRHKLVQNTSPSAPNSRRKYRGKLNSRRCVSAS
jgi:hypothetical protein